MGTVLFHFSQSNVVICDTFVRVRMQIYKYGQNEIKLQLTILSGGDGSLERKGLVIIGSVLRGLMFRFC